MGGLSPAQRAAQIAAGYSQNLNNQTQQGPFGTSGPGALGVGGFGPPRTGQSTNIDRSSPAGAALYQAYKDSGVVFDSNNNVIYNPADLGAAQVESTRALRGLSPSDRTTNTTSPQYLQSVYKASEGRVTQVRSGIETLNAERAKIQDAARITQFDIDTLKSQIGKSPTSTSQLGDQSLFRSIQGYEANLKAQQEQLIDIDKARQNLASQEAKIKRQQTQIGFDIVSSNNAVKETTPQRQARSSSISGNQGNATNAIQKQLQYQSSINTRAEGVQSPFNNVVQTGQIKVRSPIQYSPLQGSTITARQLKQIQSGKASESSILGLPQTRTSGKVLPDILPSSTDFVSFSPPKEEKIEQNTPIFAGSLTSFATQYGPKQSPAKPEPIKDFLEGFAAPALNFGKLLISLPEGLYKEATAGSYTKAKQVGEQFMEKQNLQPTLLNSLISGKPTGRSKEYDIGTGVGEAALILAPVAAGHIFPKGKLTPFGKSITKSEDIGSVKPINKQGPPEPDVILDFTKSTPKGGMKAFPQRQTRDQGYGEKPNLPKGERPKEDINIEKAFEIPRPPTSESGITKGPRIPGLRKTIFDIPNRPRKPTVKTLELDPFYNPKENLPRTRADEIGKLKIQSKKIFESDTTNPLRGILSESPSIVKDTTTTKGPSINNILQLNQLRRNYPNVFGKSVAQRTAEDAAKRRTQFRKESIPLGFGVPRSVRPGIGFIQLREFRSDPFSLGRGIGFKPTRDGGLGLTFTRPRPPTKPDEPKTKTTKNGLQLILKQPEQIKSAEQLLQIKPLRKQTQKPLIQIQPTKNKQETKSDAISRQFFAGQSRQAKKRQQNAIDRIAKINSNINSIYGTKQSQTQRSKEKQKQPQIISPIFAPRQRQGQRIPYPVPQIQSPKFATPQKQSPKLDQPFPIPPELKFPEPPPKRFNLNIPVRIPPFRPFGGGGGGPFRGGKRPRKKFVASEVDPLRAAVLLPDNVTELVGRTPKVFKQIDINLGRERKRKGRTGGVDAEPFKGFDGRLLARKNLSGLL